MNWWNEYQSYRASMRAYDRAVNAKRVSAKMRRLFSGALFVRDVNRGKY